MKIQKGAVKPKIVVTLTGQLFYERGAAPIVKKYSESYVPENKGETGFTEVLGSFIMLLYNF